MNNFAISSGGIGEALTRSASALAAANNTLDESIALIVGANTVVQNPESVGTAFKTLSMRIRGAKTELEEAGLDTEGMASSVSKLRDEIKSLSGVDIMADDDTFKSTIQILRELSGVWDDLTDVTRANITELIAGKRQANVINSIFQNWDTVEKSLATSLDSNGSALEEHAKWLDSIEAKTNQLKASWQALSKDFISSDLVKGGIDFLIKLAGGLDSVINSFGGLGFVAGALGLSGLIKFFVTVLPLLKATQANLGSLWVTLGVGKGMLTGFFHTLRGGITIVGLAVAAIALLVNAIDSHREAQRNQWNETVENAKAVSEEYKKIVELRKAFDEAQKAYEDGSGSKSDYDDATNNLLESLGFEESQIDRLIQKHGGLKEAIEAETKAKEEDYKTNLLNSIAASKDLANDDTRPFTAKDYAIGAGISLISNGAGFTYMKKKEGVFGLPEDPRDAMRELEARRQSYIDKYGEEAYDIEGFKKINNEIQKRKQHLEDLYAAEKEYFDLLASWDVDDYIEKSGKINSYTDYVELLEKIETTLGNSSTFEDSGRDARKYALDYLSGFKEYDEYYKKFLSENKTIPQLVADSFKEANARIEIGGGDFSKEILDWIDNELSEDQRKIVFQIALDTPTSALWDLDQWKQKIESVSSSVDVASESLDGFYNLLRDEEDGNFTERIGKMQERISKLQEIRSSLGKYATNESKYSLITEFPELVGSIDNINELDDALNRLINDSYEGINSEFAQEIENLGGVATASGDALYELQRTFSAVRDVVFELGSFDTYKTQYSNMQSAVSNGYSSGGMSIEDVQNIVSMYGQLDGYDPKLLFEKTSQGIQLNSNALRILNKEYENQQKSKYVDYLAYLNREYSELSGKLQMAHSAEEDSAWRSRLDAIQKEADAVALEAAAYDGLTSSFKAWQDAQKQIDPRNSWEQVGKGVEGVQEIIDAGFVNDSEVIAYINHFLSSSEQVTEWAQLNADTWSDVTNTISRYYDGTAASLETFLQDAMEAQGAMDWITQDENGKYTIDLDVGEAEELAKSMTENLDGIQLSGENVVEMLKALQDVGIVHIESDLDEPIKDTNQIVENIEEAQKRSREHAELNLDSQKAWASTDKLRKLLSEVIRDAKSPKELKFNTGDAIAKLQELNEKLAKLQDKDIRVNVYTGTIYTKTGGYTGSVSAPGRNGPSRANGTAFAHGNWGTRSSGVALTGELGQELVVRDGSYFTVGDNGAEFFKYKPGDIVFNARQTEEILKYGGTKGRGTALAEGTAFLRGNGATGSVQFPTVNNSSKKKNSSSSASSNRNSSSNSSSSSEAEEFEETLDWIEVKIDRVERAINELDTLAQSVYKSWTSRNRNLSSEISEVVNEISIAQAGYNRYIQEANSVGLSESWAQKVRDGLIDIDTITDEDLADKIKSYEEWYNKAIDLKDKIIELRETEASLYKQRFDNVITEYEGYLGVIEHERSMLEESISQTEARGYIVSEKYYKALQETEEKNIKKLEAEKTALLAELQNGVSSGTIVKESEAWYEMISDIDGVTESIAQANTQLIEYSNNIRDIKWEVFDLIQDRISKVADEADFLIKLIDEHLYSDVGQLTDKGMTVMGMHGQNYNVYMAQSARYADEILKLNKQITEDPYNQDLIKRREELLDLQRDSILAAEGEKDAIKDMVEEGINLELESMKKLIDTYTEALDSQKDLYDYQKKTAKQTKEIASLQKQLAAYQGDDSEENRARVQKIQTQLAEAQEELQESQYDKMVDDQKTMLDEFYDEYSALLNSRLDDVDTLVQEMIVVLNDNAVAISDTLTAETQNVGYTLTEEMRSIWDKNAVDTANALQFVTDGILDNTTTVNTTLNTINANIASMISILNARAKTDVKAAQTSTAAKSTQANAKPSASSSSKSSTTSKASTSSSSSSGGKRTDAENYGVALAIWNGNYGWGNGLDRKKRLEAKGFNYATIQSIISKMDKDGYVHRGTWPGKYYGIKDLAPYHYNKFAIGAKRIYEDQLAWTQEYGKEYIISPTSGAVLTPLSKGDSVLNANASKNLWNMANTPGDFIKDVLGVDYNAPNSSGGNGVYTQNFESVVFTMPNVKNYDEMLRQMQRDRNFERLIKAMSIDIMDGKSSLNKTKAIK